MTGGVRFLHYGRNDKGRRAGTGPAPTRTLLEGLEGVEYGHERGGDYFEAGNGVL